MKSVGTAIGKVLASLRGRPRADGEGRSLWPLRAERCACERSDSRHAKAHLRTATRFSETDSRRDSAGTGVLDVRVANLDCESDAAKIERGARRHARARRADGVPAGGEGGGALRRSRGVAGAISRRLCATLGFPARRRARHAPESLRLWKNPKVLDLGRFGRAASVWVVLGYLGRARRAAPLAPQSWGLAGVVYVLSLLVGGYYFGREAHRGADLRARGRDRAADDGRGRRRDAHGRAGRGRDARLPLLDLRGRRGLHRGEDAIGGPGAHGPRAQDGARARRERDGVAAGGRDPGRGGRGRATSSSSSPVSRSPPTARSLAGTSSVNQAPVTGESVPVEKAPGDTVFAGTINGEGALEVRATKAFAENTIARIIHMVEEAQERKGQSERFIERFGKRYSPAVLATRRPDRPLPPLLFAAPWMTWITRATVFIVAAAPCALVISIPITLVAALGTGRSEGRAHQGRRLRRGAVAKSRSWPWTRPGRSRTARRR